MTISFDFHGDLPQLLRGRWKGLCKISIQHLRRTSIKDMIESFGLPHTEIGSIVTEGKEVDFSLIVEGRGDFSVYPAPSPWDILSPSVLRPIPLEKVSFIVDINVGRLARYLRAVGIDTMYDPRWSDKKKTEKVLEEKRILLSKDMQLLKRKQIVFGRYVRAIKPIDQFYEIVKLFGLAGEYSMFTRCLECNSLLLPVDKEEVVHQLEPLTKKYYTSFSRCAECNKVYWAGSHIERMRELFSDYSLLKSG